MIEVKGLKKQFGDFTAVNRINFNINPGEVVGFLGHNGAGKTTTIKMITGLLEPDEGHALVAGRDIQKEPIKAKAQFAYVPDTPNLYGKLKAMEYLRFMGQLYRVPADLVRHRHTAGSGAPAARTGAWRSARLRVTENLPAPAARSAAAHD